MNMGLSRTDWEEKYAVKLSTEILGFALELGITQKGSMLQQMIRMEFLLWAMAGHNSIITTQRYLKVNLHGLQNLLKKFHPLK